MSAAVNADGSSVATRAFVSVSDPRHPERRGGADPTNTNYYIVRYVQVFECPCHVGVGGWDGGLPTEVRRECDS